MHARPIIFAAPLAALAFGCQSDQPKPEKFDKSVWASPHTGLVGHNQPVAVAEGPPPVVYQAVTPGSFHVADLTTGGTVASGVARNMDIVRVDTRGVFIGKDRITTSPLPADHRYTIYVDPQTRD